jgi:MoxR-like ATPase
MLDAMQQQRAHVGPTVHALPDPFCVLATRSPREQGDTHPLRVGQLDRFLLYVKVDYPSGPDEWEIASRAAAGPPEQISAMISAEDIVAYQQLASRVSVSDQVLGYAWALTRASRPGQEESADFVDRWVEWGAGPRGTLGLIAAARARAILQGRFHATVGDVTAVSKPVLRHRVSGNDAALANAMTSDGLIDMLMEAVPPEGKYEKPEEIRKP